MLAGVRAVDPPCRPVGLPAGKAHPGGRGRRAGVRKPGWGRGRHRKGKWGGMVATGCGEQGPPSGAPGVPAAWGLGSRAGGWPCAGPQSRTGTCRLLLMPSPRVPGRPRSFVLWGGDGVSGWPQLLRVPVDLLCGRLVPHQLTAAQTRGVGGGEGLRPAPALCSRLVLSGQSCEGGLL